MKVRVLIVEDEPPLQRSIKQAIESTNPNFQVVGLAFNGQTALAMIEELCPDVIVTDIRMPVMDGIELMSHLSRLHPGIIIVVLSGYQEFDYVKKALQSGALNYLLKPISLSELSHMLEQIYKTVTETRMESLLDYVQQLLNNEDPAELSEALPRYQEFHVLLVCAGSFPTFSMDYLLRARFFWDEFELGKTLAELVRPDIDAWVFEGKSSAEKIIILALPETEKLRQKEHFLSQLQALFLNTAFPITIVVSKSFTSLRNIGLTAQMLRTVLSSKIVFGSAQTLLQEESNPSPEELGLLEMPILDSGRENRILLLLKQEDAAGLKLELKQLFQTLEHDPKPQLWVEKLMKHLVTVSQHAILSNGASSSLNLDLATDEAISNSSNYNELMQNMWFIFEDLMWRRKHRTEEKVKASELLLRLDEFLQEHLHENLNNTLLSKKFGFAPSYLSKLFRNYKGMSPSEYLINLRVEKAKQLMKSDPDISSKEIAIILGYSDPLYYSKIFKKVTGVWPSDYKTIISGS